MDIDAGPLMLNRMVGGARVPCSLALEEGVDGRIEFISALEEGQFHHERIAEQRATELLDQGARGCSGSACVPSYQYVRRVISMEDANGDAPDAGTHQWQ